MKLYKTLTKRGHKIVIETESKADFKTLSATVGYLIAKKKKPKKVLMLPMMIRNLMQ